MRTSWLVCALFGTLILSGCAEEQPLAKPSKPEKAASAPAKQAAPKAQAAVKEEAEKQEQPRGASQPDAEPEAQETQEAAGEPGKIVGTVVWQGDLPELADFPIEKNPEVCCREGSQCITREDGSDWRATERLVVDPETSGVIDTVVHLEDMKGKGMSVDRLGRGPFQLDQRYCRYVPRMLIAPVGARLRMTSGDKTLHNIHMYGAASYNLAFGDPKVQYRRPLRKPGLVRVVCDAGHAWMTAYIHVAEHPYYAVTSATGQFELTDVPPGSHRIALWHEGWSIVGRRKDNAGAIARYEFTEPIVLHKDITVTPGETTEVTWELSEEIASQFQKPEVPGR